MTIITGDTHRDFRRVGTLCDKLKTTKEYDYNTEHRLKSVGVPYYKSK